MSKDELIQRVEAFGRYLKSPKGRWDFLDYGGFLLGSLIFCGLVFVGGVWLGLV